MRKKVVSRGLFGVPVGIAIGYVITILISVGWGGGYYSPCVPELADQLGSEIGAVVLQAALCGLLGMGFGAASVIWEVEKWSISRQTGLYFLCTVLVMMPVAYALYWMEHSLFGFLTYFGIYLLIFVGIWLIQYMAARCSVRKMNAGLK